MTNRYDAFKALQNAALNAAVFLEVTAERQDRGELSAAEYGNRLKDVATLLRGSVTETGDLFFTPEPGCGPMPATNSVAT